MLRKIRITCAAVFFTLITALLLDFTGTLHAWLGWMAKVQFLPALLAMNVGVVVGLLVLTLVFGRVYCSVICPLGVMQDIFGRLGRTGKKKKYRYSYSPALSWLRWGVFVLFVAAMITGVGAFVALLAPYSAYGRIAQNLLQPIYVGVNNIFAYLAERAGSYAFYEREVWMRSVPTFIVAALTLVVLGILAWRNGRTYCNTVCPVGTVLGWVSRFSWLKIHIDTDRCNGCGLCARSCKAACIDPKAHRVDYSRCVTCGDCIGACHKDAISYVHKATRCGERENEGGSEVTDSSRRTFIIGAAVATSTAVLAQERKKVDGGLAVIEDKIVPVRKTPITPPGSLSARNFAQHCTACQLCVSACPNDVLRPSTGLMTLMQPTVSYERGYCRPECTRCGDVCPTGAIKPISRADKSATQVGHAVWISKNCLPVTDGVSCGNCARHCPTGAIQMVPSVPGDETSPRIPAVNTERCIGCGACENLCPARPFSAIYVEGHEVHRNV